MTAAARAQMKVIEQAAELDRTRPMIDLENPDEGRRLSFEDSLELIEERYGDAIDLLGKL